MFTVRQLPLPFPLPSNRAAEEFIVAPSNAAALAWLARPNDWPFLRLILHGPPGGGKTHLLHAWCEQVGGEMLSGPALRDSPIAPVPAPVAVDDADLAEEQALLHMINAAGQAARPLLLASRDAPGHWHVRLPDLASRLRASLTVGLGPAEDALLRPLLARLLAERQLDVSPALQDWLLLRLPREAAAVAEAVARLDRAALTRRHGITRGLAAQIIAELLATRAGGPTGDARADEIFMHPSPSGRKLL